MYRQQSFYEEPDKAATIKTVKRYLGETYQKKRWQLFLLEPHLQSPQLSTDKIQTSRSNSTEDKLIRYLDAKQEIADCERALSVLNDINRPLLKMLYMDNNGNNTHMVVAKKLGMVSNAGDMHGNVDVPNGTYYRKLDSDCLAFADLFKLADYKMVVN